MHFVKN